MRGARPGSPHGHARGAAGAVVRIARELILVCPPHTHNHPHPSPSPSPLTLTLTLALNLTLTLVLALDQVLVGVLGMPWLRILVEMYLGW